MSEWQPIETAPKRKPILLWYPWAGGDHDGAPDGFTFIGVWSYRDDGTEEWADPVDYEAIGDGCTHWMPLPPAPPQRL